jgi:hypothetical protein
MRARMRLHIGERRMAPSINTGLGFRHRAEPA